MNHLSISNHEMLCLKQRAVSQQIYHVEPSFPLVRIRDALSAINGDYGTSLISVRAKGNDLRFVAAVLQDNLYPMMQLHGLLRTYLRGDWYIQFGQHNVSLGESRIVVRSIEIGGVIEDHDLFAKVFNESVTKLYRSH